MVYTRSTQYAIRAILYLAIHSNQGLCRIEKIAKQEKIPQAFLAKLIQRLVKRNLIHSIRGTKGGVQLNLPPEKITLFMIADSIEDFSNGNMMCALGDYECSAFTWVHVSFNIPYIIRFTPDPSFITAIN